MAAVVISVEAVRVDNAILFDYLTSEFVLEEPDMGSTDPNILIDNNCMDDKLHFGIPVGSGNFEEKGDESDESDAIATASWRRRPTTEFVRFNLGTSDVNGYEGKDGDEADGDANDEEEAS